MKEKTTKILKISLGVFCGAALGFLYYRFVGCLSGTCPIVRNPYSSIAFGALLGMLFSWNINTKRGAENADL